MISIPLENPSFDASVQTYIQNEYYVVGNGLLDNTTNVPMHGQILSTCYIEGFRNGWSIDKADSSSVRSGAQIIGTKADGTTSGLLTANFSLLADNNPIISGTESYIEKFNIEPENLGGLNYLSNIYLYNYWGIWPKLKTLHSSSIPDVKEINQVCTVSTSNLKSPYRIRFTYSLGEPIFPPVHIHLPQKISFGSVVIGSNRVAPLTIDLEADSAGYGTLTFKADSLQDYNTGKLGGASYRITTPGNDNTYVTLDGTNGVPVSYTVGTTSFSSLVKLIVPSDATAGEQTTNINVTFKQL